MTAPTAAEVRVAVAEHLAAHGLAVHAPSGAYPPGLDAPAVFYGAMPEAPDLAVTVNVYDWQTGRDKHNPDVYVQMRWRGGPDPREVDDYAERAFALLDEAARYTLPGGVRVLLSRRVVTSEAGRDSNGRYERPESYRFTIHPKGTQ